MLGEQVFDGMKGTPSHAGRRLVKPYREVTARDWKRVSLSVSLAVLIICVSAAALVSRFWPIGLLVWLVLFVGGSLVVLIRWHADVTAYRCGACGHEFEITALVDFISPHMVSTKYLKCPSCGRRSWATVLMKEECGRPPSTSPTSAAGKERSSGRP
jgi:DNA-directed RNA polymerase subunit RPC12/RpoP